MRITIAIEVERTEGRFASREVLVEEIEDLLGGEIEVREPEAIYEIRSVSLVPPERERRAR